VVSEFQKYETPYSSGNTSGNVFSPANDHTNNTSAVNQLSVFCEAAKPVQLTVEGQSTYAMGNNDHIVVLKWTVGERNFARSPLIFIVEMLDKSDGRVQWKPMGKVNLPC